MAGPQFVGPTGAQFQQNEIQTMQQGIESIANMGKFLESQRQYNESQKLLVDKFHQDQLQNLQEKYQKMFDQKVKDSVGGTAMDVATTDPDFMTDFISITTGKDRASAQQELQNVMSQDNNPEAQSRWFMQLLGREAQEQAPAKTGPVSSDSLQAAANAIAGQGAEAPPSIPASASVAGRPAAASPTTPQGGSTSKAAMSGRDMWHEGQTTSKMYNRSPGASSAHASPVAAPMPRLGIAGGGKENLSPAPARQAPVDKGTEAISSESNDVVAKDEAAAKEDLLRNIDFTVKPKDKPITIVKKTNELENLGKKTTADFIRMQTNPEERASFLKAKASQMNKGSWWQALEVVTGKETNKSMKEEHPEWNTVLNIPISFNYHTGELHTSRVIVSTMKLDEKKRIKPISLFASYCPFCGEKYEQES